MFLGRKGDGGRSPLNTILMNDEVTNWPRYVFKKIVCRKILFIL